MISIETLVDDTLYKNVIYVLGYDVQGNEKLYDNETKSLSQLDEWMTKDLPKIIKSRIDESGSAWIEKPELVLLMDLKLAKGKFRPMLKKYVSELSEDEVKANTKGGFQIMLKFLQDHHQIENVALYVKTIKDSIGCITKMRGIGVATATLILSLLPIENDYTPPYFSEEAFEYFVAVPYRTNFENQKDYKSKVKFSIGEYTDEFLPVLFKLVTESKDISMIQVERGGWAIRKCFNTPAKSKCVECDIEGDDLRQYKLAKQPTWNNFEPEPKIGLKRKPTKSISADGNLKKEELNYDKSQKKRKTKES